MSKEHFAFVADDIHFVGGPVCTVDRPCVGIAAIRQDLQNFVAMHVQLMGVGTTLVTGTTVRQRFETRGEAIHAAGVERVIADLTVEVRDGKIVNSLSVVDVSDPQTVQALAYQRAQQGLPSMPIVPSAVPRTGGGYGASIIRRLGDG